MRLISERHGSAQMARHRIGVYLDTVLSLLVQVVYAPLAHSTGLSLHAVLVPLIVALRLDKSLKGGAIVSDAQAFSWTRSQR
jgi:hypothetical protein